MLSMLTRDRADARRARPALSPPASYWLVGALLLAFMAAASAPSPLYPVFAQRLGFSTATLTLVFAVYAVALLLALLVLGRLSDHIGRRPVLLGALLTEAVAMAVFAYADSVPALMLARVVQGLATGAATGAIGAALVDLQPTSGKLGAPLVNAVAPNLGMSIGAPVAGLLVQTLVAPQRWLFDALALVFLLLALAVAAMPETVSRRAGALGSLRPAVAVPPQAQREFLATVPVLVAGWATGGLYLSLGTTIAAEVLGVRSHLVGGLVVAAVTFTGAIALAVGRGLAAQPAKVGGVVMLGLGTAVGMVGILLGSVPVYFVGLVLAGPGFGLSFFGALTTLASLALPHQRSGLFSAMYVVNYLAFSVPAVVAGFLAPVVGLTVVALGYGALVLLCAVVVALRAGMESISGAPQTR